MYASSTSYIDVVVSVPSKELPCTLCSTVCSMTVKIHTEEPVMSRLECVVWGR